MLRVFSFHENLYMLVYIFANNFSKIMHFDFIFPNICIFVWTFSGQVDFHIHILTGQLYCFFKKQSILHIQYITP